MAIVMPGERLPHPQLYFKDLTTDVDFGGLARVLRAMDDSHNKSPFGGSKTVPRVHEGLMLDLSIND